jgi:hypothetical protein
VFLSNWEVLVDWAGTSDAWLGCSSKTAAAFFASGVDAGEEIAKAGQKKLKEMHNTRQIVLIKGICFSFNKII